MMMGWETAAATEDDSGTSGGSGSSANGSRGGPCANTRVSGREGWAALARRAAGANVGEWKRCRRGRGAGRRAGVTSAGAVALVTAADRTAALVEFSS